MYRRPELYDAIYSLKDYEQEAALIDTLVDKYKVCPGNSLLDVACGTGKHISHWQPKYDCEGLDKSVHLLKAARERNPEAVFHEGDMMFFDLGRWFDVVTCLFSAIGYARTFDGLELAMARIGRHTAPGGVAIVEPWIFPENWRDGHLSSDHVDLPDYKVARMSLSKRQGDISHLNFHLMLGTPEGIETWEDKSELGLFTRAEYHVAMKRGGLTPHFVEGGLSDRGLYVGTKPL